MPDFDAEEIFAEDGSFTDTGRAIMVAAAGDDHKETKAFDDIPNFAGLCKVHADTKSKLGAKLDNVIQKPADDASDDVKSAYREQVAIAAGAPAKAEDYEFFKPENLPEGLEYSSEADAKFREIFFKQRASAALVKELTQVYAEMQIENFNALAEFNKSEAAKKADDEQQLFDKDCEIMKGKHPGDQLAVFTRTALAAINEFGAEDLKAKLKTADMYTNAADLAKWRENGVPLDTLRFMHNVATKSMDAELLGKSAGIASAGTKKSMYGRTHAQIGNK